VIHLLGVKRSWSTQRLIPTAICSASLLIHFHSIIWTNPSTYPFSRVTPYPRCYLESILFLLIVVAFALNALTQLFLEGAITRPLPGHADSLLPRWDEDFYNMLIRIGTASFEATSVAGLGNEVGTVPLARPGELEMNRAGVLYLTHAVDVSSNGRHSQRKDGFDNEIRRIKVEAASEGWMPLGWRTWFKLVLAFRRASANFLAVVWRRVTFQLPPGRPQANAAIGDVNEGTAIVGLDREREVDLDYDVYRRFLSGEDVSDDEGEFEPSTVGVAAEDTDDELESHSETGSDDEPEALAANAMSSATAPLLLAHMSSPNTTLTRRGYSRLSAGGPQPSDTWEGFVDGRRATVGTRAPASDDDHRRFCVVCTVEERRIICWPCR
jgi:hypothetical protein